MHTHETRPTDPPTEKGAVSPTELAPLSEAASSYNGFDAPIFAAGEVLDDTYEIGALLGQGGMGQVFEAYDSVLDRRVAIKALWPHVEAGTLRREARALAAVRHPSMVAVHGMGIYRGIEYVVMERIYGVSLLTHLKRRRTTREPFSIAEAIEVLIGIASGLGAVHRAGLAHRDVKPANVMLAPGHRVVVMDFGISHVEAEPSPFPQLSGTAMYMAPESICAAIVPGRTYLVDVYALGVIAYEVLSGSPPFTGKTLPEICKMHVEQPVPDVSTVRKDIPAPLAKLVSELLAKNPELRPQSMESIEWRLRTLRQADAGSESESFSVLIVDDDPVVTEVMRLIVRKTIPGAEVRSVADGERAIESVRRRVPNAILLDLHMPGMNGIEVVMTLRGTHVADRCTIVSVSAGAQEHDIHLLQQLGITRFVRKGPDMRAQLVPVLTEIQRLM